MQTKKETTDLVNECFQMIEYPKQREAARPFGIQRQESGNKPEGLKQLKKLLAVELANNPNWTQEDKKKIAAKHGLSLKQVYKYHWD